MDLQYPIGKFKRPTEYTDADRQSWEDMKQLFAKALG